MEKRLGKYEIMEELGRGGFATVYRAHDTVLKRDVALKILHPALQADPDFVVRFENDARAAAQLDHPHIVTVYDLGELDGWLFIAMQLLSGGTLSGRIDTEGPYSFRETVPFVQTVAEALDYAHGEGFVHRDIKPANILLNERGEPVVTDFGLVKAAESSVVARSSSGGVIGTPAYIAPEVWDGKPAGPPADVYALGCMLFAMLTGDPMFKGESSAAVMRAHFQPHEYPAAWPEGVPSEIVQVLERALAQDPADRYPSAGAFYTDLEALAESKVEADELAGPYRALQRALATEGWERALALAREIAQQEPDYRDVAALAQQAAEGQARAERAQWADQWREQAREAEAKGELDAARVAAQRWLEMAPGDEEAQALLGRLESTRVATLPATEVLEKERKHVVPPTLTVADMKRAQRARRLQSVPVWVWVVGGMVLAAVVIVVGMLALGGMPRGGGEETPAAVAEATAAPTAAATDSPAVGPTAVPAIPTPTPAAFVLTATSMADTPDVSFEVETLLAADYQDMRLQYEGAVRQVLETIVDESNTLIVIRDVYAGQETVIVDLPGWNLNPVWSPDGSKVAFTSWDTDQGLGRLYTVFDNGAYLTEVSGEYSASINGINWSPDGRYLVFFDASTGCVRLIWVEGDALADLACMEAQSPVWSPDGERIAFITQDIQDVNDADAFALHVADVASGSLTRLTGSDDGFTESGPRWAADGSWVAFQRAEVYPDGSVSDLYEWWGMLWDGSMEQPLSSGFQAQAGQWGGEPVVIDQSYLPWEQVVLSQDAGTAE